LTAVPVPTYFTLGRERLPSAVEEAISGGNPEIAPNLLYLGELQLYGCQLTGR
jgi:hypothetical protein